MSKKAVEFGAINLAQGFPDFNPDPKLIDALSFHARQQKNQYAPMSGVQELRDAIALKHQNCQSVNYCPDSEITVTAGATQAISTAINTLISPNDEVIVFEPIYDAYEPLIQLNGGKVVPVTLDAPEFSINWSKVADAVTVKTRAILINTPHNPCGTMLSKDDLNELAKIIKDKNIYIISDEVYEHITFDSESHLSISTHPDLKEKAFIISSFGKTLHITGWKVGYCLASKELTREFRKAHQFIVYSVNTPAQYAITDILKDESSYQSVGQFYQGKRDALTKKLLETKFKFKPAKSTYFQLIDYSHLNYSDGLSLTDFLVKDKGISLIPLEPFYKVSSAPKFVRICFAKNNTTLQSSVSKLVDL